MSRPRTALWNPSRHYVSAFLGLMLLGAAIAAGNACTDDTLPAAASDAGSDAGDAATDTDAASTTTDAAACTTVAVATTGAADTHCAAIATQGTSAASCVIEAGTDDDAGTDADADASSTTDAGACTYGATMYGQTGDDDACKYHLVWSTNSEVCASTSGIPIKVTITNKSDGTPVTGLPDGLLVETFVSIADGGCDEQSTHAGTNTGVALTETSTGTGVYAGTVVFDIAGFWTMRFHIHEECTSGLPDSPHGTAAFHLTVP